MQTSQPAVAPSAPLAAQPARQQRKILTIADPVTKKLINETDVRETIEAGTDYNLGSFI
jgi:hypothetical protein